MYQYVSLALTIAAILFFVFDWIIDRSMNIISDTISDYANGKYGYLTTFGFAFLGVAIIFITMHLYPDATCIGYKVLKGLMLLYGCFLGLLSVFSCDKEGENTLRGKIHTKLAAIAMVSVSVCMFCFFGLGWYEGECRFFTLILAIINLVALLIFSIKNGKRRGIWERICMFSQLFWIFSLVLNH